MGEGFGEWLTGAMRNAGIRNQTELANSINVTSSAVNTWVRNRRKPDITMVGPLARALGIPRLRVWQAMGIVPHIDEELTLLVADVLESADAKRTELILEMLAVAQALPEEVFRAKLDELRILGQHYRREGTPE